jgi:Trp operon repressor
MDYYTRTTQAYQLLIKMLDTALEENKEEIKLSRLMIEVTIYERFSLTKQWLNPKLKIFEELGKLELTEREIIIRKTIPKVADNLPNKINEVI